MQEIGQGPARGTRVARLGMPLEEVTATVETRIIFPILGSLTFAALWLVAIVRDVLCLRSQKWRLPLESPVTRNSPWTGQACMRLGSQPSPPSQTLSEQS